MEYSTWSRFEKVPLSNGIITRRTGLHTMKSPEEVCAYYRDHFGPYWFNEVPKTDNTYSPTSKYYGCTLAPGIPLIPNLSRRPLRSYSGSYKYSFESSLSEDFSTTNHYNTRLENKLFNGENQENGYSFVGLTCTPSPGVLGTTVDSDSDCDDVQFYKRSQNTVTWFSWIITTFTTITTVITRPFTRKTHSQNNISMRMPLKQHRQIPWYQYPVLWLYRLALLVHQVDVWFWSKVYSALGVDSWGTPKQRRKWTLILLLLPILLWAGYQLWIWHSDSGVTFHPDIPSLLQTTWQLLSSRAHAVNAWLWSSIAEYNEAASWSEIFNPLKVSIMSVWVYAGECLATAAATLVEGSVTTLNAAGDIMSSALMWLLTSVASLPSLVSSTLALAAYPFTSSGSADPAPSEINTRLPDAPTMMAHHADPPSLDHLLSDKHLLSLLVRNLLDSEEFGRAMAEHQRTSQQGIDSALNSMFTATLSNIDEEFSKAKAELKDKITLEEASVEEKMNTLKQQIQDLQRALQEHKIVFVDQASLESRVESQIATRRQMQSEEQIKLKEQFLIEVGRVREELKKEISNIQLNQNVMLNPINAKESLSVNQSEIEALVNSRVERLLAIYDADKIAKVDYALATSGGSVLSTRCTETYTKKNAHYFMLGYPMWSKAANDPRIALQPTIQPGECWAFTGSRGHLVIELSENVTVTSFTMEHLPRSLSPTGTIDTAPNNFRVLGLESEQDDAPILLGTFRYLDNGVSLQQFKAQELDHGFKIVELVIESNQGNLEYTCLYRFRVHGRPVRTS